MVMINIAKIELIIATENYLLNIFSVITFFTNWIIFYPFYSHLIKIKGFKYSMDKYILQQIK